MRLRFLTCYINLDKYQAQVFSFLLQYLKMAKNHHPFIYLRVCNKYFHCFIKKSLIRYFLDLHILNWLANKLRYQLKHLWYPAMGVEYPLRPQWHIILKYITFYHVYQSIIQTSSLENCYF